MKKYLIIGSIVVGIFLLLPKSAPSPSTVHTPITNSPMPTINKSSTSVVVNGESYVTSWVKIDPEKNMTLIPNFQKKLSFKYIIDQNNCSEAINGSFYSTSNTPLGLFQTNSDIVSNEVHSLLMNGFIYRENNTTYIDSQSPQGNTAFSLQSGPLLIAQGQQLSLKIANDEPARRSVAFVDKEGRTYLLIIYKDEELFNGPYLEDLPSLVSKFADNQGIEVESAINLDGGSASAFHSGEITIQELSYIGSVLCVTP